MTGLELFLLGGFEGRGPGGAPVAIAPRKVRALLVYLGFHLGKALPREHLSALIWGDISADEQARRSLRQALTTLRRELPEGALDARRDEIMLCASASVDVSSFEHAARQKERSSLEHALRLYRGELLEGFSGRASGFDAWLERERKRLHGLAADAMQRLCEIQRADGDAAASMATAMRLVATDPVREAAHRLLMELYVEAGRASEAVRQFNTLRALLQEKLGTAPDAQTSELLERIRRSSERRQTQTSPPPRTAPASAPELRPACVLAIAPDERGFDAALERDVEIVLARFGGSLMRVARHGAVGVFGFPRAHDNDLERGVRAALALCRLERLSVAAVGVASGPLLVEQGTGAPVLRGEVLARASELQALEGHGVIVAGSVAVALGEALESQPAGAELDARRVTRFLENVEVACRSPLVGRQYELAQLGSALDLCAGTGRGRTFIVRGEAGIGKTRLIRALSELAASKGFCVHVRSIVDFGDDAREQPTQGIVRELLADQRSREPGAPPKAHGPALDEAELSLLLDMAREVSRSDASTQEAGGRALYLHRRRAAACSLLALRSTETPRLIWIDDIHWADESTLAQIAAWSEVAASHPLLLMLTTRNEAEAGIGALHALLRGRPVTTLDLAPLTPEETRELALALEPGDEQKAEIVSSRAGGNPLFIEQLSRYPHASRVPPGISSLVQARSDQLDPAERATLQAASVLGQHFTLAALSHLLEQESPSTATLIAQSLISEHADGYAFVHALVRAAVYDGLQPERRARLHASAARHYAGRDAALHAEHLGRAGDEGAAAAYVLASSSERRAGNAERALALCLRGRELAERSRDRYAAALLLGELSLDLGRSQAALEAFAAAHAGASDSGERVRAHLGRAAALRVLDRSKEALLELAAAERELDPQREPALVSRIHYMRGNVLFPLGDWAACLQSQTLAFEAARRTGSSLAEAQALSGMADAHMLAGRWRTARACFVRCEQASRQVAALELELTSRGMCHLLDGFELSFAESAAGSREVAERSRASGSLRAEVVARLSAAWALLILGEWEGALAEARRCMSVADALGAQRFIALGIAYSSIARARLGDRLAAHSELERALALARASSLQFAGPVVYAALLATADDERIPELLVEADAMIGSTLSVIGVTLVLHGTEAALKVGDLTRAGYYADRLAASMREEPHALGAVLIDFSRTLCAFQRQPGAESGRCELARLRERLVLAGMRSSVSFVEHTLASLPAP